MLFRIDETARYKFSVNAVVDQLGVNTQLQD